MIVYNYGKWQDESDVGLGYGYASLQIDTKNKKIIQDDFPVGRYELTVDEAIEFVKDNEEEFFEDNIEDILQMFRVL